MATILIVDDDPHIRDVVHYALQRDGHAVVVATNGIEALHLAGRQAFDLVVLDVLMPEMDGLEVCRNLRATGTTPVLFLSSRGEETDRIVGLELGGDDYVTKPFSPRELSTRVKAILRRTRVPAPARSEDALRHNDVELLVSRHEVRVKGVRVEMTVTEFALLRALIERPGHVLTRQQLMDRIYSDDTHVSDRTIDSHVKRVRAKLRDAGADVIETVHGLGYRVADDG